MCLLLSLLVGRCSLLSAAPPDVVLIVADDLGWGDLSCYGAADLQTPAIDQLAAEGQRWENFYANCCVCSPTRASLMTGCYPDRVGVPGVIRTHPENSWGQLAAVPTLPSVLQQHGYQTACVGKWHLGLSAGDHPLDRGFDHFQGFLGDMMDDYFTHRRHDINYMRHDRQEIDPSGHATQLFGDWASEQIARLSGNPQPYFLYLAYNAPHTPIQPPDAALARVRQRLPDLPEKRAKLVALIEDMDASIAQVVQRIRATGRETLIIFTSDNGGQIDVGANNGPWRDGKQSNYEGGLRVPTIFQWTGQIPAGSRTTAIGASMDLLPTICELVGANSPNDVDGQSLTTWLTSPAAEQAPREIYFVRREGGFRYAGLTIEALRQGDWKLVHNYPTQAFELFNLQADPREEQDLADAQPAKLRSLLQALMVHGQRGGQVPWQPTPKD